MVDGGSGGRDGVGDGNDAEEGRECRGLEGYDDLCGPARHGRGGRRRAAGWGATGTRGTWAVGLGRGRGTGSWSVCTEIEAGQFKEDRDRDVAEATVQRYARLGLVTTKALAAVPLKVVVVELGP